MADGTFILAGHSAGFGSPEHNFYVVRFDPNGNIKWEKSIGSIYHDGAENILKISENKILLTGRSNGKSVTDEDMLQILIDADGNKLSEKYFGETGSDQGNQAILVNGFIYTAGKKTNSAGNEDGLMMSVPVDSF
jgi:hypothetical protein